MGPPDLSERPFLVEARCQESGGGTPGEARAGRDDGSRHPLPVSWQVRDLHEHDQGRSYPAHRGRCGTSWNSEHGASAPSARQEPCIFERSHVARPSRGTPLPVDVGSMEMSADPATSDRHGHDATALGRPVLTPVRRVPAVQSASPDRVRGRRPRGRPRGWHRRRGSRRRRSAA